MAQARGIRSVRPHVVFLWLASILLVGGSVAARAGAAAAGPRGATTAPSAPQASIVRLYVPFGPGSSTDAAVRNFQKSAARFDHQPIEAVYLAAESGAAASRVVHGALPDGRTLLFARVGASAILPALSPRTTVPLAEFTAVAVLDQTPLVCAVRSGSAIRSMNDLQAAIAAAPGQLRYSTAGAGTLQNLAVRYLLALSGLPPDAARPLHLAQGPKATQALLDGEVDFSCNTAINIVPQVQAGALRALMTTAQGRLKALPQVRNAAELGLRDMQQLQAWSALLGPPGMSTEVVARWRRLLEQVADDPEWQAGTEALSAVPRIRTVPDAAQFLRQQAQFYERLVMLLGARS